MHENPNVRHFQTLWIFQNKLEFSRQKIKVSLFWHENPNMRHFWLLVKHCVTFSKYFSKFGYGICFDKLFGFWKTWKLELLLMCQWTISLEGQPAMTFIDKPPLLLLRRGLTTEKIYLHPRINAVMKKSFLSQWLNLENYGFENGIF